MADPGPENAERERIESIAGESWYARGVNGVMVGYSGEVFARHFRGGSCLELGPGEGVMTGLLDREFKSLTIVDGSARFCADLRERYPKAEVIQSMFEDFDTEALFDAIVLGHVLEHVIDPPALLRAAKGWLAPTGSIYAAVPNARSLHRQAAVMMGILGEEHELNEQDHHHGHRRVYDPESFRHDFIGAGLKIEIFGGFWIKPVANSQIESDWTEEMVRSFMELGERYPDIAAEIYVIAGH